MNWDAVLAIIYAIMYMLAVAEKKVLEKRFENFNKQSDIRKSLFKDALEDVCFFIAGFVVVVRLFNIFYC